MEVGDLGDRRPRLLEVGSRCSILGACDDEGIALDAWQYGYDDERGRGKVDRLFPGLAVGQEDDAALEIDLLPSGVQDFPKARASQDQELDGGNRERVEFRPPFARGGGVLRARFSLVDLPG